MSLQISTNDVLLSLETMGYTKDYILRAIAVHKKSKRGTQFDLSLLVEIISRLKLKDSKQSKLQSSQPPKPFKPHFESIDEALKLDINDTVDYRFENGRVILCKILEKNVDDNKHYVLLLHPLSEPLTITKHNRYCDIDTEYHQLSAPKSVSLRKLSQQNHPLYDVQIGDYIDINPFHKKGHKGWKYGRITKIDPKSSQVKVIYYHQRERNNYSYWVHLENVMETAPFKTKSDTFSEINLSDDDEEMYINPDTPNSSTPGDTSSPTLPPLNHNYSMDSIMSHNSDYPQRLMLTNRYSVESHSKDWISNSIDSTHSDSHIFDSRHLSYSYSHCMVPPVPTVVESKTDDVILEQLETFGYEYSDIMTARENVANPDDINQIIEFLTALDMTTMLEIAANDNPLPLSPLNDNIEDSAESKMDKIDKITPSKEKRSHFRYAESANHAIFGIKSIMLDCTLMTDKDYGAPIPDILIKLKSQLFANNGQYLEGIFSVNPDITEWQQIQQQIDNDIQHTDFRQIDSMLIANLIKIWFKKLPQPILHDIDTDKIMQCKNMNIAGSIIENDIGEPYESYFKWLLDLCWDITKNEKVNKMSIKNMAICIGPNLYDISNIKNPIKAKIVSAAMVKFVQLAILWRHFSK